MKKILTIAAALAIAFMPAKADEGMWMLPLLEKMNIATMQDLGCRLSADQIYSINHSSLKDAIVQFGGGCTGEIVSDEGLLLTNHHCGYASIQKLSTVDHDYLTDGYWAMNRGEELPVEGLTVTFLESMADVTDQFNAAMKKAEKMYRDSTDKEELVKAYVNENVYEKLIGKAEEENPHCEAYIVPFYDYNVYYLIVYKVFKDIRFVGAPPSSIGKFGADTDNWMWPRHTGDFSIFRVYADKDNNPAEYSADNVPYSPKKHLKISLGGVKEGDYTMIMGYPGSTTRFQTSPELELKLKLNDIRIAARTIRQDILMEDMLADPAIRIKYANKYASSSNGWKKWQGMKLAFGKLDVIGRAEQEEEEFSSWAAGKKSRTEKYGNALNTIREGISEGTAANVQYTIATESIYRIELQQMAAKMNNLFKTTIGKETDKDTLEALRTAYEQLLPVYKDYSAPTDRKVAAAMIGYYRDNAAEDMALSDISGDFGNMDIAGYVDTLFRTSIFVSPEKLKAAIEEKGWDAVKDDPASILARQVNKVIVSQYPKLAQSDKTLSEGRKAYTAGLLEWHKGEPSYPDANFTMRLTYGTVGGYSPKDAVIYRYYTTLDGVMEKEDPDNWEFVVPARLKELYEARDFGPYAMPDGKMPVAFLSNNDITGGNSGSPVLNADGDLLGLAFDGNWESMSSDVMFEPDLQRCINVDIRYVLFIIDKFGGAGWLLDEMDIVYPSAAGENSGK